MSVYIDKQEFAQEMENWRTSAENPDDRIPSERLGELLLQLHRNILGHKNFVRYSRDLKDEMVSYSLWRILKSGLKCYDPAKGSTPFAYFSAAAFRNYVTVIKRYYKALNGKQKYMRKVLDGLDTKGDEVLERLVKEWRQSEDYFGLANNYEEYKRGAVDGE